MSVKSTENCDSHYDLNKNFLIQKFSTLNISVFFALRMIVDLGPERLIIVVLLQCKVEYYPVYCNVQLLRVLVKCGLALTEKQKEKFINI